MSDEPITAAMLPNVLLGETKQNLLQAIDLATGDVETYDILQTGNYNVTCELPKNYYELEGSSERFIPYTVALTARNGVKFSGTVHMREAHMKHLDSNNREHIFTPTACALSVVDDSVLLVAVKIAEYWYPVMQSEGQDITPLEASSE